MALRGFFMRLLYLAYSLILMSSYAHADRPLPDAAWPSFRGNTNNTGFVPAAFTPDPLRQPWSYTTGKGIFSTAVVDEYDQIYIGSADSWFYAFSAEGRLVWRYKTEEIIDSAAVLTDAGGVRQITIPSGDGRLHHLKLPEPGEETAPELIWRFDAKVYPHPAGKGYNWFEGNVVVGPDGKYYAGNTNWNFYAVHPDGALAWTFAANNMNWSAAAFDEAGYLYVTSLDGEFRKLDPKTGQLLWSRSSLGFNAGSLALAQDLVIGTSFDRKVYALDKRSGKIRWTFSTRDHIYGSPAIVEDDSDLRIYVTSTDGFLYALNRDGQLRWAYDSGDVIRSSPVVNRASDGRDVIYFGGGDGLLRAVNEDGNLRWAFDTNAPDPYLLDRNDLNASPVLTSKGVVIGGEHGQVWFVPYDYPLLHPENPRSIRKEAETVDGIHARMITPGSRLLPLGVTSEVSPATVLTVRIENRKQGIRQPGGVNAWWGKTKVRIEPSVPFTWEPSAQADTLYIRPQDFWEPGTRYRIFIDGEWMWDGVKVGALEFGASQWQAFQSALDFQVTPIEGPLPWATAESRPDAVEIRRLSVNQPSIMPSLNQIGFDSYDFLVSLIEKTSPDAKGEGRLLAWIRSAKKEADGTIKTLENAEFRFPIAGRYKGDAFVLKGENIPLNLGGIQVKLKQIEFRGQFTASGAISPLTSFYAEPSASVFGCVSGGALLPCSSELMERGKSEGSHDRRPRGCGSGF
jgi:outer membrane protein assembly factor BamB